MPESFDEAFPGGFEECVRTLSDEDSVDNPEELCGWLQEHGFEAIKDLNPDSVLAGLEVEYVSVVDEPAQDSEWLIAKSAGADEDEFDPEAEPLRTGQFLVRKQDWAVQFPEYDSAADTDDPWNGLDLEDFPDDLSEQDPEVYNHFIASETGFPPEEFDDLNLEVVAADGTLVLEALEDAWSSVENLDAPPEVVAEASEVIRELVNEEFPDSELADELPSDEDVEASVPEKSKSHSDEERKVWAAVLIPGEVDKQGDLVPEPEIESAAHRYLKDYRKVDEDHNLLDGSGTPVESYVLKQETEFELPDGGTRTYPKGTWIMGVELDENAWKRVKSGELSGFSIYGGANPLEPGELLTDKQKEVLLSMGYGSNKRTAEKQLGADALASVAEALRSYFDEEGGTVDNTTLAEFMSWALDTDMSELDDTVEVGGVTIPIHPEDAESESGDEEQESGNGDETEQEKDTDMSDETNDKLDQILEKTDSISKSVENVEERVSELENEVFEKGGDEQGGEQETTDDLDEETVEEKAAKAVDDRLSELLDGDADEDDEVVRKFQSTVNKDTSEESSGDGLNFSLDGITAETEEA